MKTVPWADKDGVIRGLLPIPRFAYFALGIGRGEDKDGGYIQLALLGRKCSAISTSTELIENKSSNALRVPMWGHTWDVYGNQIEQL